MAPKHVHDLFSAAYDGTLGGAQAERFRAHVDTCPECAQAYDVFRTSVDAVRALPAARMPLPVHLPSDAPVPEQTLAARLRRLPRFRFVPGAATGVAAVAAAAIVVLALNHQGGGNVATNRGIGPNANSVAGGAPACPQPVPASANPASPTAYQHRVSASDRGRPGQELVLATQTGSAAPGTQVLVYARLSVPQPSAGAPGAAAARSAAPVNTTAVVPCLRVSGAGPLAFAPAHSVKTDGNAAAPVVPNGLSQAPGIPAGSEAIQAFTIPAGTAPGTVLYITATIPANYPLAGDPTLSVDLAITVG